MDFLYEKDITPSGISVETISGGEDKSPKVWKLFAMQIFSEADGDYRELEHYPSGAPALYGVPMRVSLSHTSHCMVVATLPKTPDVDLGGFSLRTAMGIDLEKADRRQVLKVKEKFLMPEEISMLPAFGEVDDVSAEVIERYILAWTCKEALYKAALGELPDWKGDYRITTLPAVARDLRDATPEKYGKAEILLRSEAQEKVEMLLSSWRFEGHIVTLAFSSKIARFPVGAQ
ncbi:MAG: 4'-phosphopantetheinyl transferase superfamily protein [Muribaculaceae bacterium]|nr:4'-phosphopantetheinyl transferase superfamily protein [Muribaculaceae bacterium]